MEDDPFGAQQEVLRIATKLGISITVGLAHQFAIKKSGTLQHLCKLVNNHEYKLTLNLLAH